MYTQVFTYFFSASDIMEAVFVLWYECQNYYSCSGRNFKKVWPSKTQTLLTLSISLRFYLNFKHTNLLQAGSIEE